MSIEQFNSAMNADNPGRDIMEVNEDLVIDIIYHWVEEALEEIHERTGVAYQRLQVRHCLRLENGVDGCWITPQVDEISRMVDPLQQEGVELEEAVFQCFLVAGRATAEWAGAKWCEEGDGDIVIWEKE
jgi:hypothetical protein